MYQGDSLILALLSIGAAILLARWLYRWLTAPPKLSHPIEPDEEIPDSEAVRVLEFAGYEVLTAKRRIPIEVMLNDSEVLESRLFVDHFAAVDDKLYVVKVARERKPLERTGSGIRDHLLVYHLLYAEAEGILYVDPRQRTIDKICFRIVND